MSCSRREAKAAIPGDNTAMQLDPWCLQGAVGVVGDVGWWMFSGLQGDPPSAELCWCLCKVG